MRHLSRILKNQPKGDLSILVAQQTRMISNVEKLSKMVILRQFRQTIFWPDLFD